MYFVSSFWWKWSNSIFKHPHLVPLRLFSKHLMMPDRGGPALSLLTGCPLSAMQTSLLSFRMARCLKKAPMLSSWPNEVHTLPLWMHRSQVKQVWLVCVFVLCCGYSLFLMKNYSCVSLRCFYFLPLSLTSTGPFLYLSKCVCVCLCVLLKIQWEIQCDSVLFWHVV